MVYQVLINFNDKKNKPLEVADSCEKFNKTTIRELKEKFRQKIPGAPDPDDARVIFGKDPLEDYRTLEFYKIKHLSVLLFVMKMPGGGGPPHPVIETQRKVSETVGLLGLFKIGSSIPKTGTEIWKIQERDSLPQYTGGTRSFSTTDRGREEKKGEGKVDPLPAGASSVQPDADLQFLQSLLPALKRMDIRQRERTKLRIQQLVFDAEFNDPNSSGKGIRRTDSMEIMPPYM